MTKFRTVIEWYNMGMNYIGVPLQKDESIREYWQRELELCGMAVEKIHDALAESPYCYRVDFRLSVDNASWCRLNVEPELYFTLGDVIYFNEADDAVMFKLSLQ